MKQRWYTPAELVVHNSPTDCWVSLNGKVFDLTSWLETQFRLCKCIKTCSCAVKTWFCEDNCHEMCKCFSEGFPYCDEKRAAMMILAFAGKDVSHWFNGDELVHYIHPIVGSKTPYYRFVTGNRQPVVPSTLWRPIEPWWLSDKYVVGRATNKTRPIRIINTLIGTSVTLEVCSEETIYQIMLRYLPHNSHMHSYTWRYNDTHLCLHKTLAENGIPDHRQQFDDLDLPNNLHVPDILIYFNDDLTEDPSKEKCYCNIGGKTGKLDPECEESRSLKDNIQK